MRFITQILETKKLLRITKQEEFLQFSSFPYYSNPVTDLQSFVFEQHHL